MSETELQRSRADRLWLIGIVLFGAFLRIIHNSNLMLSPLYVVPLGGHRIFLDTARLIAGGDFLPGDRPFTESSPFLPYLYAGPDFLFGENFLLLRLIGIFADLTTIFLVGRLGRRFFGVAGERISALLYAVYGPAVYFSAELIYIPFVLTLLTAVLVLLTAERPKAFLSGLLSGLAIGFMPNAVLFIPFLLVALFVGNWRRFFASAARFAAGVIIAVAPVTLANILNSGELVFLTTTAGHNFYLGHNPSSKAGYFMPGEIDGIVLSSRGSTFDAMKKLAELRTGETMKDGEVSSFFFREGWREILRNPDREFRMLLKRLSAFSAKSEYLTYGSYRYAEEYSSVLSYLPRFDLLLAGALFGVFVLPRDRRAYVLLVPVAVSVLSVLMFFFLSRFRMLVVPSFCVMTAGGLLQLSRLRDENRFLSFGMTLLVAGLVWAFSYLSYRPERSANEWNKEGGIYLKLGEMERALASFERARSDDPTDPLAFRNLSLVYQRMGMADRAQAMQLEADRRSTGATR